MTNERILFLQDRTSLDIDLLMALIRSGYALHPAATFEEALPWLAQMHFDLVMAVLDGPLASCPWCRDLRAAAEAPILLLGPFEEATAVAEALDHGADVYLPTHTAIPIVEAHIAALLRRRSQDSAEQPLAASVHSRTYYRDERLVIDVERHSVTVEGKPVDLTPTEFRLLALLLENANHPVTYEQILTAVWGWEEGDHSYIHTHVSNLRRKLGESRRSPRYLQGEYGVGYAFLRQH